MYSAFYTSFNIIIDLHRRNSVQRSCSLSEVALPVCTKTQFWNQDWPNLNLHRFITTV